MSTTEMIRFDEVALAQGGFRMTGLTLSVPAGGYALMIGPTGAGKTTLLEAIAGHVPPTRGRILLGGVDMTTVPPEARGVGFVYQSYHLFPHLSVRDNIGYGLRRHPAPEAAARVTELAALLGLTPLLDRGIRGLSGGEQQRVALARALAPRPRIRRRNRNASVALRARFTSSRQPRERPTCWPWSSAQAMTRGLSYVDSRIECAL